MPLLTEISCDAFRTYNNQPRPTIEFHQGLNTVLGGAAANNSIGKSTFLLIIDYCFGGETYQKSNVKNFVGDHTVYFAFQFDDRKEYFSRTVSDTKHVNRCDENKNVIEVLSLAKYKELLMREYFPRMESGTFRDIVSRFFRIAGKKNDTIVNILNNGSPKMEPAIESLERLFGLYYYVGELKTKLKDANEKSKAIRAAQKHELLPSVIKNDKQRDKNEEKIKVLIAEKNSLTQDTDEELLQLELQRKENAAEINARLQSMKRQYRKLSSQYRIVTKNQDESFIATENDLLKLGAFFPGVNIKRIEEVEDFHRELHGILTEELNEEAASLQVLIKAAGEEIRKLEAELAEMGISLQVPKSFLDRYSEIETQIATLRAQNRAYEQKQQFRDDSEAAGKDLEASESQILEDIENRINSQLTRFNDRIYSERREAPSIKFKNGKSYSFFTPRDDGTGTAYKSLIILDMAIMELTDLPAVIHDSSIFKNVGDEPIDGIMELYMESNKQVFIAFDKAHAYSEETGRILEETAVLRLDEGGNELFGWCWAKKKAEK